MAAERRLERQHSFFSLGFWGSSMKNQRQMARIAVFLLCVVSALVQAQQPQPEDKRKFKITKIEFAGLKLYTHQQALAVSELQVGQDIDLTGIKAASARLLKSGLFRRANYHYQFVDDQAELVFEVVEVRSSPCIFDNFIWFQRQEIIHTIRQTLPNFDGTAPEHELTILRIKQSLQTLLQEKGLPGQVDYIFSGGEDGAPANHIFAIKSPAPFVCSVRVDGAKGGRENELLKIAKPLLNGEYSVAVTRQFIAMNLLPLYRKQGFLRASFHEISAQADSSNKCKNGAAVTITVNEGAAYTWEKVSWAGNEALTVSALDAALGLKPGEVANGEKIESGLNAVLKAYLKAGYVTAALTPKPSFDEASNRITYEVAVNEGGQYKMGQISAPGFSEGDVKKLLGNWKLKPGDIFDAVYFSEYMEKKTEDLKLRLQGRQVKGQLLPDKQKLTVDVKVSIVSM